MLKDIVVHLTGSDEDEVRISYAEIVSERYEAHLRGLYVYSMPEVVTADPSMVIMPAISSLYDEYAAQAEKNLKRLKERFSRLTMPHDVQQLDVLSGGVGQLLATKARASDLFIATRPYGDPADDLNVEVAVLLGSGRGCLFVPPKGKGSAGFGSIVVAWDGSREAARAVSEAMPFLRRAVQVVVVTVSEEKDGFRQIDIARHLSRHGISVTLNNLDNGPEGVGAALLAETKRLGADLLVMGGYGHSRLREWVLGGATRHVLKHADISVLMAR
jgi:nucleotide-binding universal stress UspA family protein